MYVRDVQLALAKDASALAQMAEASRAVEAARTYQSIGGRHSAVAAAASPATHQVRAMMEIAGQIFDLGRSEIMTDRKAWISSIRRCVEHFQNEQAANPRLESNHASQLDPEFERALQILEDGETVEPLAATEITLEQLELLEATTSMLATMVPTLPAQVSWTKPLSQSLLAKFIARSEQVLVADKYRFFVKTTSPHDQDRLDFVKFRLYRVLQSLSNDVLCIVTTPRGSVNHGEGLTGLSLLCSSSARAAVQEALDSLDPVLGGLFHETTSEMLASFQLSRPLMYVASGL